MTPADPSLGCAFFNQLPYRFVPSDRPGVAIVELDVIDDVLGPNNSVHAGVTMVLADVAGAMAVATHHDRGGATSQVSVHCLAAAKVGPLRATATVLRASKTSAVADVRVVDVGNNELLVAVAHVTCALFQPRAEEAT